MPRLITSSWNGEVHHAINYSEGRPAHLGQPLGRILSTIEVSEDDARLGIDKLVALQDFRGARQ